MTRSLLVAVLAIAVIACTRHHPGQQAATGPAQPQAQAQPQTLTRAQVVTAERADQEAKPFWVLWLPIGLGTNGTQLVASFLAQADVAGAAMVSDLAIYLRTVRDGQVVECRSEIVPDTETSSGWLPPPLELVPAGGLVTRTVTEYEQRCATLERTETETVIAPVRRCHSVRKPVTRTRTTYSTSYDSRSGSFRTTPGTGIYTDYTTEERCHSWPTPVQRTKYVPFRKCSTALVTRTATRYEFQFAGHFAPPRLDMLTRQRLRELAPVCYVLTGIPR